MRGGWRWAGWLLLILCVGLAWFVRRASREVRIEAEPPPERVAEQPADLAAPLLPPPIVEALPAAVESVTESVATRAALPAGAAPRTRAIVQGRLVIANSGEPLDEALELRLRTGDVSLTESLVSAPDGSFASSLEFPRGLLLLKVLRPNGDMAVDLEWPFDPASTEPWIAPVPWPTFVHGYALDGNGEPLRGLDVLVARRDGAEKSLFGRTRVGGEFQVHGLRPGKHVLYLRQGLVSHTLECDVKRGPNELGELRIPMLGEADGVIEGRVFANDGPVVMLMLVDLERGVVATADTVTGAESDQIAFRFEGIPSGAYRLNLVACDGRRYEPSSLRLSPPASGLEFRAVGVQDIFHLQAVDEHGEELDTFGLVRLHGQWLMSGGDFARADVEQWILLSPGRRSARGLQPAESVLRVRLEPGHAQAFQFSEAGYDTSFPNGGGTRGRAVAGIEVVADGVVVARSEADGLAVIDLARPPGTIEYRHPGWVQVAYQANGLLTSVALARE